MENSNGVIFKSSKNGCLETESTSLSMNPFPDRLCGNLPLPDPRNITDIRTNCVDIEQKSYSDISNKRKLSDQYAATSKKLSKDEEYFRCYEDINIHLDMIKDVARTNTYRLAILKSCDSIIGKVVADVGAGTGILSCFCVQAGAKKVYAIEASSIADKAKEIVKNNNMEDKIQVIQGKVEDIELPEKVDVIVSEWMGHFLVYESMLNSVITARDRWLKEKGKMLPSRASIYIAPFCEENMYADRIDSWNDVKSQYGVDMFCMTHHAKEDACRRIHLYNVSESSLISHGQKVIELDLNKVTHDEVQRLEGKFSFNCFGCTKFTGFVSWFDVMFDSVNEGKEQVQLTTSPETIPTHWMHCAMYVPEPVDVELDTPIEGTIQMIPSQKNNRYLDVKINYTVGNSVMASRVYQLHGD